VSNDTVIVKLLNKEYQVACPPGQEQALLQSAKYLDQQMQAIRGSGKVIGLERIAVMASLNISHELLQQSGGEKATELSNGQVKKLSDKIDGALQKFSQLEIG
jgi:cell division protein ZapA